MNPTDYGPQHSDFASRQQEGTGRWLLDSQEYKTWKTTAGETLFCPGIPGAGKTILTSIAVNDITSASGSSPDVANAYIHCSYGRRGEQDIDHLLSSLIKQLALIHLSLPALKALYDSHPPRNTRPRFNELTQVLSSVASLSSRIFILLDALDESDHGNTGSPFMRAVFDLRNKFNANSYASSRDISELRETI